VPIDDDDVTTNKLKAEAKEIANKPSKLGYVIGAFLLGLILGIVFF